MADPILAVPVVSGLSPSTGPAGTSVVISGTGFTGATAVAFGATAAKSFVVSSDISIVAVSPDGSGTSDVTVTTPAGKSAVSAADKFFVLATPTVSGIAPAEGPSTGGTVVAITGVNLSGATAVKFGAAPASSFAVNNDTSIVATAPSGAEAVDVVVVTPAGASVLGTKFTYVGVPAVVATRTKEIPKGDGVVVIPKIGTVLVTDPAGYGVTEYGYLSVGLPPGTAENDVVEVYAISARGDHAGIIVLVFPPIGESIDDRPENTGTNDRAAASVTSYSGRRFTKVSAKNWRSLGGGN